MKHSELHKVLHAGIRHADRKTFKEAYRLMRALKSTVVNTAYSSTGNNNMTKVVDEVLWSNVFCGVPPDVEAELANLLFRSHDAAYPAIEYRNKWLMKVNCSGDSRRFVKREDLERKLRLDMNNGIM